MALCTAQAHAASATIIIISVAKTTFEIGGDSIILDAVNPIAIDILPGPPIQIPTAPSFVLVRSGSPDGTYAATFTSAVTINGMTFDVVRSATLKIENIYTHTLSLRAGNSVVANLGSSGLLTLSFPPRGPFVVIGATFLFVPSDFDLAQVFVVPIPVLDRRTLFLMIGLIVVIGVWAIRTGA